MKKLILRNGQSPGDIVVLTAAVRDLHRTYPSQYLTDVRTPYPDLWENNPFISPLQENEPNVTVIDCHYPLIHESNQLPYHFIHGFMQYLNSQLSLSIRPTAFKGDIYLSDQEKSTQSQVESLLGTSVPYWIIVAGGKYDFTAKWWPAERFQDVVAYFANKVLFVQVGLEGHYHPRLHGVIDLVGKTSLRQLVHLVYHSDGVLCPVTLAMHLAVAIETRKGAAPKRACVVVGGGREPAHWESYPGHQYIHTIGALPCCAHGGCWKSRTFPLGDGDGNDQNLCVDVVDKVPRCLNMIRPIDVARRIEMYFEGGTCSCLSDAHLDSIRNPELLTWV